MARNIPSQPTIPPTCSPAQAIELLRRQVERSAQVQQLSSQDPEVKKWVNTTENILHATFGKPNGLSHPNTNEFSTMRAGLPLHMNMSDSEWQQHHIRITQRRRALHEGFIEQLQDLAPPAAAVAPDKYRFHPEIERVSGQLYRDGHYKQAALEAYIRVIDEVKSKSGLALDGDNLINRAFGSEKQTPVIQFNSLQTDEERDEQKGFMFLYKGIIGLRNSKAHSNRLFNDPSRAHEYLALASLLIRLLEIAVVDKSAQP